MKRNRENALRKIIERTFGEKPQTEKYASFWSVVMIFFVMSLMGWLWEVGLHLLAGGGFVNRGLFHGPWLPIYGFGSVMILLLLRRLQKRPLLEFMAIVLLCGCMEYFASWFLEQIYDGKKWWDYSGYFLNLNGRICVEGLLAFGLGGMVIVYFFAPFLNRVFRYIPHKIMISICLVLIVLFGIDLVCSVKNPNVGRGIVTVPEESGMVIQYNGRK